MRKGLVKLVLGATLATASLGSFRVQAEEKSEDKESIFLIKNLSFEEIKEHAARLPPVEKKAWLMIAKYHNIDIDPEHIDLEKASALIAKVDNGDAGKLNALYDYKGDLNNNGLIDFNEAKPKNLYSNEEPINFVLEVRNKHVGKNLVFRLFDADKQLQVGKDIHPELSSQGKIARVTYKPGSLSEGTYLCSAFIGDTYISGSCVEVKSPRNIELDKLREEAKELQTKIEQLEAKNKK